MTTLRRGGATTAMLLGGLLLATACKRKDESHAGHGAGLPVGSAPLTAATVPDEHAAHGGDASSPTGYAPVTIDPSRAAALGLRTALVAERDFQRTVRTVGVVSLDETRTTHVHAKVRGWIDTLNVNFVGRKVTTGEPLCSIYSQEVFAAEIEFLSVLDRVQSRSAPSDGASARPPAGEFAAAEQRAQEQLLAAARRRLSLWDVPSAEIDRLENVSMDLGISHGLAVPESAVIRTGPRSIVFVAHGEHAEHLEPREIRIGSLVADFYPVESGLKVGESVASGAQFLLDSESRLRATSGGGAAHGH